MRNTIKRVGGVIAISALALTTVAATESDGAGQLAKDAADAFATTLADQAEYDAQYASNPSPCRLDGLVAEGVPQVDFVLGVTRAQDHAAGTAECVSLDQTAEYEIELRVMFQYYDSGSRSWLDIPGTAQTCRIDAQAGQSGLPCATSHLYEVNDPTVNKWHRAKYELLEPIRLGPDYSNPFLSAITPTL
jgi:hypothetical protein